MPASFTRPTSAAAGLANAEIIGRPPGFRFDYAAGHMWSCRRPGYFLDYAGPSTLPSAFAALGCSPAQTRPLRARRHDRQRSIEPATRAAGVCTITIRCVKSAGRRAGSCKLNDATRAESSDQCTALRPRFNARRQPRLHLARRPRGRAARPPGGDRYLGTVKVQTHGGNCDAIGFPPLTGRKSR